jgi:large subunit ribosomal protein L10
MPSASILEKKKVIVKKLSENIKSAKGIIFADYRGLTVEQDTELRVALRNAGVKYSVVKNTLTKLAIKENEIEGLDNFMEGPTSMAFSEEDVVAPAKVLSQFADKFEHLQIKVGIVEGKVVDLNTIKELAELPSKEVLVARALGGLKSPISGFVNVLNGNLRGLVVALNAIAENKANS